MDLDDAAGAILMVGLPAPNATPDDRAFLARVRPSGVVLFRRNLAEPERLRDLVAVVRETLGGRAILAIDQDGGRVSRLEPWIGPTPAAAVLAARGPDAVRRFAAATGRALRALGLDVDFAPVVDLCAPETPNGVGDRAFGTDPEAVARLAGAFLAGLQGEGVAGCLKHFPGLGDTTVDSHVVLPVVSRARAALEAADFRPYRALGRDAASVMVSHGSFPALGVAPGVPATLSPEVVGILRRDLGFRGLVVTDDMDMGAVAPLDRDGAAAVAAVRAGCDLVLYCRDTDAAERARDALLAAAENDPAFGERLRDAASATRRFAARWSARNLPDIAAWRDAARDLRAASA